jgi:tetratricopeptide (TPR) repeat protein
LLEGGFFPVHAVLVRAEAVRAAGLFDESLTSVEDWDLWLRITANGGVMVSIPEPLARYRVSVASMSTNAGRMHANRMAALSRQFGLPEGNPLSWATEKRRGYAFAYRMAAYGHIAQQEVDEGWRHLQQAVGIEPDLLERLDTFYELALGDQPRGYRGETTQVDIAANGAEMLRRLDILFASASPSVQALKGVAYGNAYLALAMLSDQAGDWAAARRYMLKAMRFDPHILANRRALRRFAKILTGRRQVKILKQALSSIASRFSSPSRLGD